MFRTKKIIIIAIVIILGNIIPIVIPDVVSRRVVTGISGGLIGYALVLITQQNKP